MEAEKQSRSSPLLIGTFLLFSNIPTSKIITITCPSLVFNSSSDLISSHFGRSCMQHESRVNSKTAWRKPQIHSHCDGGKLFNRGWLQLILPSFERGQTDLNHMRVLVLPHTQRQTPPTCPQKAHKVPYQIWASQFPLSIHLKTRHHHANNYSQE